MDVAKLVRMANQIGHFFEAMPDHAEALDGIATHIKKF
ncbi:formate dehydrogenase subunit delta [Roseateles aquae]